MTPAAAADPPPTPPNTTRPDPGSPDRHVTLYRHTVSQYRTSQNHSQAATRLHAVVKAKEDRTQHSTHHTGHRTVRV
eukprot:1877725-Rhodomonas_salina.1